MDTTDDKLIWRGDLLWSFNYNYGKVFFDLEEEGIGQDFDTTSLVLIRGSIRLLPTHWDNGK